MKLKRYKVTAKNVEYLMTNYFKAINIEDAKEKFRIRFNNGDIAVGSSEIQFAEVSIQTI